jgi:hypothetical protein
MKNRLKKLSMLKGKKRYIVFGLLAVELMSLPAAAQIVHRVAFDIRPIVTAVEIPTTEPGVSRYLVASNAGFGVKANGVIGDIQTEVHVSGSMGKLNRFGDAAQLPGPDSMCAQASGLSSDIYAADRKTAATPGTPPEQAVIFEFRYDVDASPDFEFVAGAGSAPALTRCSNVSS